MDAGLARDIVGVLRSVNRNLVRFKLPADQKANISTVYKTLGD